jgi:hypothetical protein
LAKEYLTRVYTSYISVIERFGEFGTRTLRKFLSNSINR